MNHGSSSSGKQKSNINSKHNQNSIGGNNLKRKREDDENNQKRPNPKKQKIENTPQKNQNTQIPSRNAHKKYVNTSTGTNNSGNSQRSPSAINKQKPQLQQSSIQNIQSRNETRGGNLFGSKKRAPTTPTGFLTSKIKSGSDPKTPKSATEPKMADQNKVINWKRFIHANQSRVCHLFNKKLKRS